MTKFWKDRNLKIKDTDEKCRSRAEVLSLDGSMSTSTYSSAHPLSFTGELDFDSDEEHNVWNELMIVLAHHECSFVCSFREVLA